MLNGVFIGDKESLAHLLKNDNYGVVFRWFSTPREYCLADIDTPDSIPDLIVFSLKYYDMLRSINDSMGLRDLIQTINLSSVHILTIILMDGQHAADLERDLMVDLQSEHADQSESHCYFVSPDGFEIGLGHVASDYARLPNSPAHIVEKLISSGLVSIDEEERKGWTMDDLSQINDHSGKNTIIEDFVQNSKTARDLIESYGSGICSSDSDLIALIREFADPLPLSKPLSTSKATRSTWRKTINAISYAMLNGDKHAVRLAGPRLSGKTEVIKTLAWRSFVGDHMPALLSDRRVFKIRNNALVPSSRSYEAVKALTNALAASSTGDVRQVILYTDSDSIFKYFSDLSPLKIPIIGEHGWLSVAGNKKQKDEGKDSFPTVKMHCPLSVDENLKILKSFINENAEFYEYNYGYVPSSAVLRKYVQVMSYGVIDVDYDPMLVLKDLNDRMVEWSYDPARGDKLEMPVSYVEKYGTDVHSITPAELGSVDRLMTRSERREVDSGSVDMISVQSSETVGHATDKTGDSDKNPLGGIKFNTSEELFQALRTKVIGQDAALKKVVPAIARRCAGLSSNERPVASFLFTGPSGVGKTETAKAIADVVYGSREALLRIDCSELYAQWMVSRLLGSSRGYVDSDMGGQLTRFVQEHPKSVILFDEIEKAHPSIYDSVLLQLLDYGHVTSPTDGEVDCTECTVIMTSNLGAAKVSNDGIRETGFGMGPDDPDSMREKLRKITDHEIEKNFRVELINRLDDKIMFDPLDVDSLVKIFKIKWSPVELRLAEKGISVDMQSDVPVWFAEKSKIDKFGARNLVRMIDHELIDKMTDIVLSGFKGILKVEVAGDKVSVRRCYMSRDGKALKTPTPLEIVRSDSGPIVVRKPDGPIDDSDEALKRFAADLNRELQRRKALKQS